MAKRYWPDSVAVYATLYRPPSDAPNTCQLTAAVGILHRDYRRCKPRGTWVLVEILGGGVKLERDVLQQPNTEHMSAYSRSRDSPQGWLQL